MVLRKLSLAESLSEMVGLLETVRFDNELSEGDLGNTSVGVHIPANF